MAKATSIVDGVGVDGYLGMISGRFDLSDEDGPSLKYDEDVMMIVVGKPNGPQFVNKKEEFFRLNVIKPTEVRVLHDAELIKKVFEALDFEYRFEVLEENEPDYFSKWILDEDEPVDDTEEDIIPDPDWFDQGFVLGDSEPEPVYTGTSDDTYDDYWETVQNKELVNA